MVAVHCAATHLCKSQSRWKFFFILELSWRVGGFPLEKVSAARHLFYSYGKSLRKDHGLSGSFQPDLHDFTPPI